MLRGKGVDVLLDAMVLTQRPVRLELAGSGRQEAMFKSQCERLGLNHRVTFVGHIPSALHLTDAEGPLLGRLFAAAADLARTEGIADAGYRLVTNVGRWGGQSVDHLHVHLMGGRSFEWPPG